MGKAKSCRDCGIGIEHRPRFTRCEACGTSIRRQRKAAYRARPENRLKARKAALEWYRAKTADVPRKGRGRQPDEYHLRILKTSYSALIKELLPRPAYQTWTTEEREHRRQLREKVRNQRKTARQRAKVPGRLKTGDLMSLFDLQKGRCFYCCKKLPKDYHVDHFMPLAKGGTNERHNLRLACPKCNMAKRTMLPEEFLGLLVA